MKKILLILILVSLVASKEYEVENGKTLILTTKDTKKESITINNRTYKWLQHPKNSNEKILIITIPYRTKPEISNNGDINIKIIEGNYKKEQIVVAQSKAKPNKENQQRIKNEREEANKIYATYTNTRFWDSPFINPMESVITSPYGSARIFNNEINSYHSGTDFRAKIGTPIYAANSGKVVIAKDRFLAGKSVVIDHGEGIFSMYYHCSEIKVKLGDIVNKGDLIALSGNSGRVSGPHLHFGILARGTQVDPIDFIQKINALFVEK